MEVCSFRSSKSGQRPKSYSAPHKKNPAIYEQKVVTPKNPRIFYYNIISSINLPRIFFKHHRQATKVAISVVIRFNNLMELFLFKNICVKIK